jgi:hypothetical protein
VKKYYLIYVTANDTLFYKDYISLFLTRSYNPGVAPVQLYIVVGGANKYSALHRWMLRRIMNMAGAGKYIEPKMVILKNNAGRDFGSAQMALQEISSEAQPDDYILIRNRSTWGPHAGNWYKKYVNLMESSDQLALVGSTIGLKDHPSRKKERDIAHVQSYIYLSRYQYVFPLLNDFPGSKATNHLEAVLQGEMELSQEMMKRGWSIASLKYPDVVINFQNQNDFTSGSMSQYEAHEVPISKDNQERNLRYYLKILLILTTIIWYAFPRKVNYRWINKI